MKFIEKTIEEESICSQYYKKKENSKFIDYIGKINDKPWGKEYLAFQNKQIGIWILIVNKDQETSLHCHFKKDTILMPISGSFKINLFNSYLQLGLFEPIYVPRNTFHGIHSYLDNSILMEIEIYTENIEYTDKNDLLRIKDIYNRDKDKYETSVTERIPLEGETMLFKSPNKYVVDNTKIEIMKINKLDDIINNFERIILLEGSLFSDSKKILSGSILDSSKKYSFLTNDIEVLCFSNIDYENYNKIIYSKNQLTDLINLKTLGNIGLTCGCFDILHEGHIKTLKACKKNCDTLFVCLSSDEQIKRLKGEKRPINNLNDRMYMLINYTFIDYIVLYNETNDKLENELDNIMNIINPDTWFKGSDYTKEDIIQKHPSLKSIKLFDLINGKSTTNIIKKII
jgi:D-beta-D-heptose 7-phosphate kinase/D-beta-D-heptose 1-phosphate adenosyltransferase